MFDTTFPKSEFLAISVQSFLNAKCDILIPSSRLGLIGIRLGSTRRGPFRSYSRHRWSTNFKNEYSIHIRTSFNNGDTTPGSILTLTFAYQFRLFFKVTRRPAQTSSGHRPTLGLANIVWFCCYSPTNLIFSLQLVDIVQSLARGWEGSIPNIQVEVGYFLFFQVTSLTATHK